MSTLGNLKFEVSKLEPQRNEIVHIAISSKTTRAEMSELLDSMKQHFPDVRFMVTAPGTSVTVEPGEKVHA